MTRCVLALESDRGDNTSSFACWVLFRLALAFPFSLAFAFVFFFAFLGFVEEARSDSWEMAMLPTVVLPSSLRCCDVGDRIVDTACAAVC